jgi:hypothetical protein
MTVLDSQKYDLLSQSIAIGIILLYNKLVVSFYQKRDKVSDKPFLLIRTYQSLAENTSHKRWYYHIPVAKFFNESN